MDAVSDAIVPSALNGDLPSLRAAWNVAVAALSQTDWQPPDYTQWQALATVNNIPIVFNQDGTF